MSELIDIAVNDRFISFCTAQFYHIDRIDIKRGLIYYTAYKDHDGKFLKGECFFNTWFSEMKKDFLYLGNY